MANENRERVAPLSDLNDYEVSDHDPDVRGWDVISADGRKIGEVEDLIVDTGAMKVRYLDVEIDKDFRADDNRRVLIPVGQAQLHEREDHVHVNALSSTDVRTYPTYSGRFDRNYEDSVHQRFGSGAAGSAAAGSDYYAHQNFDDERFYGARRGTGGSSAKHARGTDSNARHSGDVRSDERGRASTERMTLSEEELAVSKSRRDAGEVRVGKHVETEHVSKDVPVEREVASVERRPIDPAEARNAKARITDDEVRVPLTEEELDVSKRAVAKEELVIRKDKVTDTEHVEADLRKERADIDKDTGSDRSGRRR